MYEFLSKIKKSAKNRDIPNGSLTPTCGALFLLTINGKATFTGGLRFF